MANDYYFFTDINQQASNASDYINVQPPEDAFGPITPGTAGTDQYRVTSLHKASYNPTAYAACDGIVCVQRIPVTITGTSPPLVNVILKPLVQPALSVLESSLVNDRKRLATTTSRNPRGCNQKNFSCSMSGTPLV